MEWRIKYYNQKLEEDILNLPDGLLARYLRLTDLMCEFGANLEMPHTKSIDGSLFELRVKGKEGNHYAPLFREEVTKDTQKRIENRQIQNERGNERCHILN